MNTSPNTQSVVGSGNRWAGLGTRVAVAAVLIPCVLTVVWLGGIWFALLAATVGVLASFEWSKLAFEGSFLQTALHALAVLIATLLVLHMSILSTLALIAFVWSASLIFTAATRQRLNIWRLLGVPYIALPLLAFVALRSDDSHGLYAVLWVLAVVWLADTLAYVFGRTIRGPKLAPTVSPNKTWAGLLGAIVGGLIASAGVAFATGLPQILPLILLGAVTGIVGQLGDLYESAIKRRVGVKDSGSIIPGHGGILDRIDALMTVALLGFAVGAWRNGFEASAEGLLVW